MAKVFNPDRPGTMIIVSSANTTTQLVAANAAKRFRLLGYHFSEAAGAAVTFVFKSNTTAITGVHSILSGDGCKAFKFPGGVSCTLGDALKVTTSGGTVKGEIWYEEMQS